MQIDQIVRLWLQNARVWLVRIARVRSWNIPGTDAWRRRRAPAVSGLYPNRAALRSELRMRAGR